MRHTVVHGLPGFLWRTLTFFFLSFLLRVLLLLVCLSFFAANLVSMGADPTLKNAAGQTLMQMKVRSHVHRTAWGAKWGNVGRDRYFGFFFPLVFPFLMCVCARAHLQRCLFLLHTGPPVQPIPAPGEAEMPAAEFERKATKAVQRGMSLREEKAAEAVENARIVAEVRARKIEEIRQRKLAAALVAKPGPAGQSTAAGSGASAAAAAAAASHRAGIEAAVDAELGLQGDRVSYTDKDGVVHYSRPSSARLSAEELKARTYKPKLDPTSVFGDAAPVHAPAPAPAPAAASYVSASAVSALVRDEDGGDDEDDDEEDRRRASFEADAGFDEPSLSYHDLLQLRGQGAAAVAAKVGGAASSSGSSSSSAAPASVSRASAAAPVAAEDDDMKFVGGGGSY